MPHQIQSKGGLVRSQFERDPPTAAATLGGVGWWFLPVPPNGGQLVQFPCGIRHWPPPLIVTLSLPAWLLGHCHCSCKGRTQRLLWEVLPPNRACQCDTNEFSPNESLSFERRCRARGGVGGFLHSPPAPMRPPPKSNRLKKPSMVSLCQKGLWLILGYLSLPSVGRAPRGSPVQSSIGCSPKCTPAPLGVCSAPRNSPIPIQCWQSATKSPKLIKHLPSTARPPLSK